MDQRSHRIGDRFLKPSSSSFALSVSSAKTHQRNGEKSKRLRGKYVQIQTHGDQGKDDEDVDIRF